MIRFEPSPVFRYPPVGRCIYCGASNTRLGDEHIVPFGLGGNRVLPKASCRACEAITGRIEQYCLRQMFGSFRAESRMQTRRPKQRPKSFPVTIQFSDHEQTVEVSAEDYPTNILLFVLPPARLLRGLEDTNIVDDARIWLWWNQQKLEALAVKLGGPIKRISVGECNPTIFSRMIAKIAHAHAVAELGLGGFQHLATNYILKGGEGFNYRVGSQMNLSELGDAPDALYQLSTITHATGTVVSLVRLFAALGGPLYHVVVGATESGEVLPVLQHWQKGEHIEPPFPGIQVSKKPPVPRV